MRSTVEPVHFAPAYSALHMLTVNLWPPAAVTPHMASRTVSAFELRSLKGPHRLADVGCSVG